MEPLTRWGVRQYVVVRVVAAVSSAVLVFALTGCAGEPSGGLCPLSLDFDGVTYHPLKTERRVHGAEPLTDVRFACLTDDAAGREDAQARFPAESVEGIDPEVAFVVPSRWPRYVFYSGPSDAKSFPPAVEKLLNR